MKAGRAFEILVKEILLHIGFAQVESDGWYIYDEGADQMIRGLGAAHNADVLVEPLIQTPFYTPTRLLVECKDYSTSVRLNVIRNALGLREDINHFDLVDREELLNRYNNKRSASRPYQYQVAVASMSGFTENAQNFAATHRISLIEFDKLPFWDEFKDRLEFDRGHWREVQSPHVVDDDYRIMEIIRETAERSAFAITETGQMIFLYKSKNDNAENSYGDRFPVFKEDEYRITWENLESPWKVRVGNEVFQFQLPKEVLKTWLEGAADPKVSAIHCKEYNFSRMVVYYSDKGYKPTIKVLSIQREYLKRELERLQNNEQ